MVIPKIESKGANRSLKHDPAKARFTYRFVGVATDPEILRLQAWSLAQLGFRCETIAAQRQEVPHGSPLP
jgi:hypothetical protein